MSSNKKLVFFDMDGTLLNSRKTINESTIQAIQDLKKKGFIFCIASGRGLSEGILEFAKQLDLQDYLVLGNGNYVWDIKNESMITLGMPLNKAVLQMFYEKAMLVKRQLNFFFEDGSIKYYYFGDDQNTDIKDSKFFVVGPTIYNFSDVNTVPFDMQKPIVHVGIKAEEEIIDKLMPELKSLEVLNLAKISNVGGVYADADPFGVSKWIGIQYVQRKLGISNENTYAFGDSENDEVMLDNVGHPVCMGNAADNVKARYKTVIGDNNSSAIADYLYQIAKDEE